MSRDPQDHLQVLWFSSRTHISEHIVTLTAMIYYNKRIQSKIGIEKRHIGRGPGESRQSFQGCSPRRVTQDELNSPWVVWDNICEMLPSKELIRDSAPRIFVGAWSQKQVTFAWHIWKFQNPRRKADVQHKLCCLQKQFRLHEPLLPVLRIVVGPFRKPSSQTPAKGPPY